MTATATMNQSGRLVLPKNIREKLHLTSTAKLKIDVRQTEGRGESRVLTE